MCQTTASSNSVYGQRRNSWEAKWDMIFDRNCKEWISFTPALGLSVYPCYSCKNMFSSKSSFNDHINRRAVVLKFNCSSCTEVLTFYSRCSLLMHTRTHYSLSEGQINLSELDIFPLPLGMAGFLPLANIPQLYCEEEDHVDDNMYINTQFYYPSLLERGKEIITLKPIELYFCPDENGQFTLALKQNSTNIPKCIFIGIDQQKHIKQQFLNSLEPVQVKEEPVEDHFTIPIISKIESLNKSVNGGANYPASPERNQLELTNGHVSPDPLIKTHEVINLPRCPECNEMQRSMAEHFLSDNIPCDEELKCSVCKFIASTRCSLRAHSRIHEYKAPYVCPECGKVCPDFNELHLHMDDYCFHLSKSVRYRCPGKKCGKLFALTQTYAAHFEVHMQCLMQCNLCKATFILEEDFATHQFSHNEQCELVKSYKCTVCTNVAGCFNDIGAKQHIQWHTKDRKRCMYVYMCRNCRSYFRSTATYSTHIMKCTKNNGIGTLKRSSEPVKYYNNKCILCNTVMVSKENNQGILCLKCKNLKYLTAKCNNCNECIIYREGNPTPHCSKCNTTNNILDSKPTKSVSSTKKYYCILCNQQLLHFEKSSHMKVCKYAKPVVVMQPVGVQLSPEKNFFSSTSDDESMDSPLKPPSESRNRKSESPKGDEASKKKRKRFNITGKNKKYSSSSSEIEMDLQAEKPIVFNGVYTCRLCYHKDTNRNDFHLHIVKHRDVQTSYQCMECGECFVVKPSLIKHLLHYHHILEPEIYIKENDCYDQKAVKQLAETMKLTPGETKYVKENQCRVCREQFEDQASLNKHFRIHGMAFLMMNSS